MRSIVLLLVIAVLLTACGDTYPVLRTLEPLPEQSVCTIAVLPFQYEGGYPQGESIFYKAFSGKLSSEAGFEIASEGDVLQLYQQNRLYRNSKPGISQILSIGQQLDAQLVVSGDILRMEERDSGNSVETEITVIIKIYDTVTGKLIWYTYHKKHGDDYRQIMHYGKVYTLSALSQKMSEEIINLWFDNGMKKCQN